MNLCGFELGNIFVQLLTKQIVHLYKCSDTDILNSKREVSETSKHLHFPPFLEYFFLNPVVTVLSSALALTICNIVAPFRLEHN